MASSIALARDLDADGVHLAQADPAPAASDRAGLVVGRSCHDGDELAGAVAEGVEYVTISPVFASSSKPGHGPALGPEGAAAVLDGHVRPPAVYGLGGIRPERIADCRLAGLDGVAVMGDVMSSAQPQHRVEQLAAAVGRRAEVTP